MRGHQVSESSSIAFTPGEPLYTALLPQEYT